MVKKSTSVGYKIFTSDIVNSFEEKTQGQNIQLSGRNNYGFLIFRRWEGAPSLKVLITPPRLNTITCAFGSVHKASLRLDKHLRVLSFAPFKKVLN